MWSKSNKNVRLVAAPGLSMPPSKGMDATLDWHRGGPQHDSRVVRFCLPGHAEETDPGNRGSRSEDYSPFYNVTSTYEGHGHMIEDGSLTVSGSPDHFDNAGAGTLPTTAPTTAPTTGAQGYARIRTRCDKGLVPSFNPTPASSAAGSGGCS